MLLGATFLFRLLLRVRVNVPHQQHSGEQALQRVALQRRGGEPGAAVPVPGRIGPGVEEVRALQQQRGAAGQGEMTRR